MTSQNITLSAKDWRDIERIKPMLLDRKSQLEMSITLGLRRETVNRKIARWTQTGDFELWLKTAWLEKYQKVDDKTAFEALTRLLSRMVTQKRQVEVEETIHETQDVNISCYSEETKDAILTAYRGINQERSSTHKPRSLH